MNQLIVIKVSSRRTTYMSDTKEHRKSVAVFNCDTAAEAKRIKDRLLNDKTSFVDPLSHELRGEFVRREDPDMLEWYFGEEIA